MRFTYSNLKDAAAQGTRVGNWSGKGVFASSQRSLEGKGSGAYYIVYDDDNAIVRRVNGSWYKYGDVSEDGHVTEYQSPRSYLREDEHRSRKESTPMRASEAPAAVVGDVKMGMDVEGTLKKARTMTIDDLLEGFNYGLD